MLLMFPHMGVHFTSSSRKDAVKLINSRRKREVEALKVRKMSLWLLLFTSILHAEGPPQTMTRILARLQSRDLPQDNFAAQPKVIYRAGSRYGRTEELPDREHAIHGLMIINEPDIWLINLFARAGKHYLDHGPTFDCRMPIFIDGDDVKSAGDLKNPLYELEFGQELAYFRRKGAVTQVGPILHGKPTNAYVVMAGDWQLILFTNGQPERPVSVTRDRGETRETIWYGAYDELPFDPKLFTKPEDVKIEEAKQ